MGDLEGLHVDGVQLESVFATASSGGRLRLQCARLVAVVLADSAGDVHDHEPRGHDRRGATGDAFKSVAPVTGGSL